MYYTISSRILKRSTADLVAFSLSASNEHCGKIGAQQKLFQNPCLLLPKTPSKLVDYYNSIMLYYKITQYHLLLGRS